MAYIGITGNIGTHEVGEMYFFDDENEWVYKFRRWKTIHGEFRAEWSTVGKVKDFMGKGFGSVDKFCIEKGYMEENAEQMAKALLPKIKHLMRVTGATVESLIEKYSPETQAVLRDLLNA